MPKTKLSAVLFLMAAGAFLLAALTSVTAHRSTMVVMGFGGVAALWLIVAFVWWRKPTPDDPRRAQGERPADQ